MSHNYRSLDLNHPHGVGTGWNKQNFSGQNRNQASLAQYKNPFILTKGVGFNARHPPLNRPAWLDEKITKTTVLKLPNPYPLQSKATQKASQQQQYLIRAIFNSHANFLMGRYIDTLKTMVYQGQRPNLQMLPIFSVAHEVTDTEPSTSNSLDERIKKAITQVKKKQMKEGQQLFHLLPTYHGKEANGSFISNMISAKSGGMFYNILLDGQNIIGRTNFNPTKPTGQGRSWNISGDIITSSRSRSGKTIILQNRKARWPSTPTHGFGLSQRYRGGLRPFQDDIEDSLRNDVIREQTIVNNFNDPHGSANQALTGQMESVLSKILSTNSNIRGDIHNAVSDIMEFFAYSRQNENMGRSRSSSVGRPPNNVRPFDDMQGEIEYKSSDSFYPDFDEEDELDLYEDIYPHGYEDEIPTSHHPNPHENQENYFGDVNVEDVLPGEEEGEFEFYDPPSPFKPIRDPESKTPEPTTPEFSTPVGPTPTPTPTPSPSPPQFMDAPQFMDEEVERELLAIDNVKEQFTPQSQDPIAPTSTQLIRVPSEELRTPASKAIPFVGSLLVQARLDAGAVQNNSNVSGEERVRRNQIMKNLYNLLWYLQDNQDDPTLSKLMIDRLIDAANENFERSINLNPKYFMNIVLHSLGGIGLTQEEKKRITLSLQTWQAGDLARRIGKRPRNEEDEEEPEQKNSQGVLVSLLRQHGTADSPTEEEAVEPDKKKRERKQPDIDDLFDSFNNKTAFDQDDFLVDPLKDKFGMDNTVMEEVEAHGVFLAQITMGFGQDDNISTNVMLPRQDNIPSSADAIPQSSTSQEIKKEEEEKQSETTLPDDSTILRIRQALQDNPDFNENEIDSKRLHKRFNLHKREVGGAVMKALTAGLPPGVEAKPKRRLLMKFVIDSFRLPRLSDYESKETWKQFIKDFNNESLWGWEEQGFLTVQERNQAFKQKDPNKIIEKIASKAIRGGVLNVPESVFTTNQSVMRWDNLDIAAVFARDSIPVPLTGGREFTKGAVVINTSPIAQLVTFYGGSNQLKSSDPTSYCKLVNHKQVSYAIHSDQLTHDLSHIKSRRLEYTVQILHDNSVVVTDSASATKDNYVVRPSMVDKEISQIGNMMGSLLEQIGLEEMIPAAAQEIVGVLFECYLVWKNKYPINICHPSQLTTSLSFLVGAYRTIVEIYETALSAYLIYFRSIPGGKFFDYPDTLNKISKTFTVTSSEHVRINNINYKFHLVDLVKLPVYFQFHLSSVAELIMHPITEIIEFELKSMEEHDTKPTPLLNYCIAVREELSYKPFGSLCRYATNGVNSICSIMSILLGFERGPPIDQRDVNVQLMKPNMGLYNRTANSFLISDFLKLLRLKNQVEQFPLYKTLDTVAEKLLNKCTISVRPDANFHPPFSDASYSVLNREASSTPSFPVDLKKSIKSHFKSFISASERKIPHHSSS